MKRYFTFGYGHRNPKTGQSLHKHYVVIEGVTIEHCRLVMLLHFDKAWAMEYATSEDAGIERWGLVELPKEEWPTAGLGKYVMSNSGIIEYKGD